MNPTNPINPSDQTPQPAPTEPTPQPQPDAPTPTVPEQPAPPLAQPAQPMGSVPTGAPAPIPTPGKKPFPKKLVILVGSIVGGLVILGVAAWLLLPLVTGGKGPLGGISSPLAGLTQSLKTYEGDGYSILVPADFTEAQVGTSGKSVSFSEKSEGTVKSSIGLTSDDYDSTDKASMIAYLKKTNNEETIKDIARQLGDDYAVENYKAGEATVNGLDAFKIEYDTKLTADVSGHLTRVYIFGKKYYSISVTALSSTPSLVANTDKIINSIQEK